VDIADLNSKTVGELQRTAERLEIKNASRLNREHLLSRVIRKLHKDREELRDEGVLEILPDGYGFLRSPDWNYLPGPEDVYLGPPQIRDFNLRTGDRVRGLVRPPRKRERYLAITKVESVNGTDPQEVRQRPGFDDLKPAYPKERLRLEIPGKEISMRILDLIAPVGKGQRGLIVSPPKAGKTTLLREMAHAIAQNHPEVHLMVLLIDERPEEVTEMQAEVKGEVIASTFDEPGTRHTQVAEMVLERAKRIVEMGRDVVILLDSITRLARAYNTATKGSGKLLSGGLDANALQKPKRFFGSARNIFDGGSLTIVATALVETGSRMDEVIFEEFKGTGNMEVLLDRQIADRRVFPAIDINRSGTRKEELLLTDKELNRVFLLRNFCGDMPPLEAIEFLIDRMKRHPTNKDFLDAMAQGG
jgi:transcription termination factor Rho